MEINKRKYFVTERKTNYGKMLSILNLIGRIFFRWLNFVKSVTHVQLNLIQKVLTNLTKLYNIK